MAASRQDVERWIQTARAQGATHVISVCDTFEWDDYPVYVMPGDDLEKVKAKYDGVNMQRINEVIPIRSAAAEKLLANRNLAEQCIADIRKHRAEIDATETVLIRLRRTGCDHKYLFTGFDSKYAYAECEGCTDRIAWEHGIPEETFGPDMKRPDLPEHGAAVVPPKGRFHSVPGRENYQVG